MSIHITMLTLFLLFSVKHFVIDFICQTQYQWSNKGKYGHPGGILHAGLHGVGTAACLLAFAWEDILFLALLDALFHYHIDWAKMNLNARMGWTATTSEYFWWLLGLDQLLHMMTYLAIIGLVI
jgi:hypothetical protein